VPFETPVGLKACPSPPHTLSPSFNPSQENSTKGSPYRESAIEPSLHNAKDKVALAALIDWDAGGFNDLGIFLIPLIHRDDPPRSMKRFGLCWHEMFFRARGSRHRRIPKLRFRTCNVRSGMILKL
jgi:hypothetical protein